MVVGDRPAERGVRFGNVEAGEANGFEQRRFAIGALG
jgi:hypothetical protein